MIIAKPNVRYNFICFKNFVIGILILMFSIVMMISPSSHCAGITKGINFCTNILVPSLFPFMILASFVVKSGFAEMLSCVMNPVTKFLFHLPGCTGATIILSLIGGYPAGAKGIKDLLSKKLINEEQAGRMSFFAVGAGPAFIISVVGEILLRSAPAGVVMFIIQVVSALILGIICGISAKLKKTPFYEIEKKKFKHVKISNAVVESCMEATSSILNMCAFVVMFSAIIFMLKDFRVLDVLSKQLMMLGIPKSVSLSILPIIFEVTSGCIDAVNFGAPLAVIAFAVSWGGICVHMQIASILKSENFSYFKFCFFRFFGGLISGLLTFVVVSFFKISVPVHLMFEQKTANIGFSSSTIGSIALVLMCLYFTASVIPYSRKKENPA